jgi:hypothetical protein
MPRRPAVAELRESQVRILGAIDDAGCLRPEEWAATEDIPVELATAEFLRLKASGLAHRLNSYDAPAADWFALTSKGTAALLDREGSR